MKRSAVIVAVALGLGGCHLIFPFDALAPGAVDAARVEDAGADALADAAADTAADLPDSQPADLPIADAALPDQALPDALLPDTTGPDASTGGAVLWSLQAGKAGGGTNQCAGVAASLTGPLLTGSIGPGVDLGGGPLTGGGAFDAFGASYSAAGTHGWSIAWGGSQIDQGWAVAVDTGGNSYITGGFRGKVSFGGAAPLVSAGQADIFVASYSPTGAHRWSVSFGGLEPDEGYALAVSGSLVHVTGYFKGTPSFGLTAYPSKGGKDIFVLALDASTGALASVRTYGGMADDVGEGVAADSSGAVFTGSFQGAIMVDGKLNTSMGGSDGYIGRLTSAGSILWGYRFGDTQDDAGNDVALDAGGNSYLAGWFWNKVDVGGGVLTSAGNDDVLLASFDPQGKHRWSRRLGGALGETGWDLDVDGANLYLTGWFYGTASFGGGSFTASQYNDIFVASYSALSGAHRWSKAFGGAGGDFGYGVAAAAGEVYLCGAFQQSVSFGGPVLSAKSVSDVFLLKLTP